ncbi:MFS general substrate transporter [Nadsonia fulvescens var. elongata DSM 6958]|uniref:MFS general substrate transporter n=1 Tax=Nadsonia fulvescens var. elongata DSM 6958 TaxID=857566 RepID=A0A1E3PHD9_9ASCO|nr:MFS general substrate transporter [Nadsonia fulvescens var. elongata DSM 6958]
MPESPQVSTLKRIIQVCCAIVWCFLSAGLVFGFAAFKPILAAEGVYRSECTPEEIANATPICSKQELKLNFIFTVAAVLTNIAALVIGVLLDKYGPKVCGLIGSGLLAIAALIMANASQITTFDAYLMGYTILALGGPFAFISSFQLSNSFPAYSGTILALLTGAFDASSGIFLIYRIIYEKTNGALTLEKFFNYYLAVPVFMALAQVFVMPYESYKVITNSDDVKTDMPSGRDENSKSSSTETTSLLDDAFEIDYTNNVHGSIQSLGNVVDSEAQNQKNEKIKRDGAFGALHDYTFYEQVKSPWFILIALFASIQMLRMNYFVATVLSQYTYMLGSFDKAFAINRFFDAALPIGGIISIPFIGIILDNFSTLTVLIILSATTLTIGILGLFPYAWAAYANISLLVLYRSFYYTALSGFCAQVFGFITFGKIYGLTICISGVVNFGQTYLDYLTHETYGMNPLPVNTGLIVTTAFLTIALIIYVKCQVQNISRRMLEKEADSASVFAMPGSQSCGNGGCANCVCDV